MERAKQNSEASKEDCPTLKTASGDDETEAKSIVPGTFLTLMLLSSTRKQDIFLRK